MENSNNIKKIEFELLPDGTINIKNNNVIKKTLLKSDTEISAIDIFNSLDAKLGDTFELVPLSDDDSSKRYLAMKMLYQLYENIIKNIKTDISNSDCGIAD